MDRTTFRRSVASPLLLVLPVALALSIASAPAAGARPLADDDQTYRTATGLLNRGLPDLAAEQYRKFLADHPDHPKAASARYALAVCLSRTGHQDEAAQELDRLIDLNGFEFAPDVKLLRGQCFIAAGDFGAAARCLHRVAADHPEYAQAAVAAALEGEAWYRAGKPAEAAKALASINPSKLDEATRDRADLFRAMADAAQGQFKDAADRLAALRERSPQSPLAARAVLTEAQCRHRIGDAKAALALYQQAVSTAAKDPTIEPPALLGLGQLTRAAGDAARAGRYLDDLLGRYADSAWADQARLERGRAYLDENKPAEALAALKPLTSTEGAADFAVEAAYWTAKAEIGLSRYDAAADRLEQAIKASPKSDLLANLIYDRAVALSRAGKQEEALEAFGAFLERFPGHELTADAALAQASLLHTAGKYDDSARVCREFIKVFPRHGRASTAALLLAENDYLAGRYDKAEAQYRAFIDQYPRDPHVWRASIRRGLALANLGKGKDARAVLEAAITTASGGKAAGADGRGGAGADPDGADHSLITAARSTLGDIAFEQSDWAAAERWLAEAASAGPDKDHADALLKLALSVHRQGRPADALKLYERIIAAEPKSPEALHATFEHGQALVEVGRLDEARKDFETVIAAEKPADGDDRRFTAHAVRHLASIAMKQNKPEEAASLLAALAHNPGAGGAGADALYQQGLAYLAAGDYAKAEHALRSFIEAQPRDERASAARVHLAIALSRQGRHQDALDEISALEGSSSKLDPALEPTLRYEKAWALKALNKPDEAAAAYRELLGRPAPPDLEAHAALDLAQLESSAGRFKEALEVLDRVVKTSRTSGTSGTTQAADDPRQAAMQDQADYLRGVCELKLERFAQAAATLGRFRDRSPTSELAASAAALAGEALLRAGKPTEAIGRLNQATTGTTSPEVLGPALLRLGEACAAADRWTASEEAFNRYLGAFATSEMVFQARFGIGWAREHQSRHEAAIESYSDVVEHHQGPTAARAQFQIGECLYAMKRYDDAVRELLKVDILYAYPEWSAAALFEAGRCFAEAGKRDEARQQFQQVIDRFPDSDWAKPARERIAAGAPAALPGRSAASPGAANPTTAPANPTKSGDRATPAASPTTKRGRSRS